MTEEYQGPERRRAPQQTETLALALAMEKLATSVETNMNEERLQTVIAGEARRDRRKIQISLMVGAVILLAVSLFGLAGTQANHRQGAQTQRIAKDAAVVADYVRSCLETPTAKRDPVKCGGDGQSAVVQGLIRYWDCALLAEPKTQGKLDTCTVQAFQAGK